MNNTERINLHFEKLSTFFVQVPGIVAETATEHYQQRFIQKNWDRQPWPKYGASSKKARKEPTRGSLMMRSNNLFKSVRPSITRPDHVRISAGSSKVKYARVHNEGFTGRVSVPSYVNSNFMGTGRTVQIKAHSKFMRIPQRQYMGNSAMLRQEILKQIRVAYQSRQI